ncbi:hypothetical protein ACIP5Y_21670 [Nocardia sp. NPDC088792]|uniref:hypothetical protein n=1 Tax=Nocardia sp. NPDC088792 TaxID=3364332 RepID=UPI0037F51FCB
MSDWRELLRLHESHPSSAQMRYGIGYLIQLVGEGFEKLQELIMTSAQSTDAALQAVTADIVSFETAAQATLTTIQADLATAVADINQVVAGGGAVQASTLTALQNAATALGTLGTGLSTAVTTLDQAVNPPAPTPPSGS